MTSISRHSIHVGGGSTALALAIAALVAGCGGDSDSGVETNAVPPFVRSIGTISYDGAGDDLLTAGLGKSGLAAATPPPTSAVPTAPELRRLAIHTNYRALVDTTAGGGFGTLYGPNVGIDGVAGSGDGKIAGTETIAYAADERSQNVTMMVQVPASFDPAAPCIVSGSSSGSRGVYGAIGTSGEWGLKHGCAVAYTDKGTGNGVHDLQADTVNLIDGRRSSAATAANASNFTARLTPAERAAFDAATPDRFAVKHAHSEQNPEKDWGRHTLQAIEFAFYVLNDRYGIPLADGSGRTKVILPSNTLVIASSVSNGAGAALAAAEQDDTGLIDGVAVSEPNIQLAPDSGLRIERGTRPAYTGGSKALYDYFSLGNLLQPCAALAPSAATGPFGYTGGTAFGAANRCAALAAAGTIGGSTTAAQAADALAKLRAYGWESDSDELHASHWLFASPSIAVTYANAHGRFRVTDNRCGFSFAAIDAAAAPTAAPAAGIATIFSTGNGIPPTGPLQLIYNDSVGGARNHAAAVSASTSAADFAYDGAACLRQLWTGTGPAATAVRTGVAEVYRTANLRGKPAIVVHGRNDALIPVNFTSRPYLLRNSQVEGAASQLRYVEVTNAQHFDSFLPFAGFDTRYIPLHLYFIRGLDAMWAHLKTGAALPASQVVRTTARGGAPGAAPALTAAQMPPIVATPLAADAITIQATTLRVPD